MQLVTSIKRTSQWKNQIGTNGMLHVNSKGRTFVKRKSASEELRRSIVDSVLAQGGDVVSGKLPRGLLSNVADQFMTSKSFVTKLWK